jgi:hypothetical protein
MRIKVVKRGPVIVTIILLRRNHIIPHNDSNNNEKHMAVGNRFLRAAQHGVSH